MHAQCVKMCNAIKFPVDKSLVNLFSVNSFCFHAGTRWILFIIFFSHFHVPEMFVVIAIYKHVRLNVVVFKLIQFLIMTF